MARGVSRAKAVAPPGKPRVNEDQRGLVGAAGPASHTPAHTSTAAAAPFRA